MVHKTLHSEDSKLSHDWLLAYRSYPKARVVIDHNAAVDRYRKHFVKTCGRSLLDLLEFIQNVNEVAHRGQRHLNLVLRIGDSGDLLQKELSWIRSVSKIL